MRWEPQQSPIHFCPLRSQLNIRPLLGSHSKPATATEPPTAWRGAPAPGSLPGWTCDAAVNATNAPGDILDFVDPARGGNIAAGQALYDSSCSFCHAAGSHDPDAEVANDLAGTGDNVIPALGSIDAAMSSVTLTQQEVDDLKAFLNSL